MNKENASKLWKMIQEAGDYLLELAGTKSVTQITLQGRNPYAHVALCVKEKFGNSYKDIPDEKFQEVLDYSFNFLKDKPKLRQENILF